MAQFRRILILGCSGAGKSTLARRLSERTGLPVTHIDQLYWQPGWIEEDPDFEHRILSVAAEPRWIIDGGLTNKPSFRQRLLRADAVILLDLPPTLCLWRVIRRTIHYYGRDRPDMRSGCPERFDRAFLAYVWNWRTQTLPRLLKRLEVFDGPIIRLTSVRDVGRFLGGVEPSSPGALARQHG